MKNAVKMLAIGALAMVAMAGCGGGSGTNQTPTTAIVKLDSQGTLPAGKSIAGIGVTVELPQGVTVKTVTGGVVAGTAVVPSGVGSQSTVTPPVYTPAAGAIPATLSFVVTSSQANGFGTGEFVTVNCDIASGASPKATDFHLTQFEAVDLGGAAIPVLSGTFTAEFK